MSKIVVYTAITGRYDTLKEPPIKPQAGVDFIAFLDHAPAATAWQVRKLCPEFADPCRNAKKHKILPHIFFPEAEYSLWIDGSIQINSSLPIQQLINEYLKEHDLAVFKHPQRQCIYEEADACIKMGKDDPAIIQRQMAIYRKENYPANNGLVEGNVLLRRHTKKNRQFNEAWYEEIKNNSRRDQLSFNYAAHKLNLGFRHLPDSLKSGPNNLFHFQLHTAEITARIIYKLHTRKTLANRLMLVFAILAFTWIPAGMVLILSDAKLRPAFPILLHLWPLTFIPLCGLGGCCLWRWWLKREIRRVKSQQMD